MKTIDVSAQSSEINSLLRQARDEDIVVRTADGAEFIVAAIDDFDYEIARTRKNAKLMSLLDERAKEAQTVSLGEVKRRLGVGG